MSKRKVVLTGAAGAVAGRMLPALQERYDLTLLDIRSTTRQGDEVPGIQIVDLSSQDRDSYRQYFQGADAVVHCAFIRTATYDDFDELYLSQWSYWNEVGNINLAYNIYRTCLEEGVRRIVVASSNHAADYYERLIWKGSWDIVTQEIYPYSDNFYGWAKISIEQLGFVFAAGHVGDRTLENVQIRIGTPTDNPLENCPIGDLQSVYRALGAYLCAQDQIQIFVKSIETDDIQNEWGIPFQIFYGISNNAHRFWSITNARKVIGYTPEDDSLIRFADQLNIHLQASNQVEQ